MELIEFLKRNGPCLSSIYTKDITSKENVSKDAARKRVSRAHNDIRRLRGKHLPKRECFLYLQSQYNSIEYFEALENTYIDSKSAPGRILQALNCRRGTIPRDFLPIASGLPTKPCKNQVPYEYAKAVLIELGLISEKQSPDGTVFIVSRNSDSMSHYRSIALAENIILEHLKKQLGNMSIVSPGVIKVRDLPNKIIPEFGSFNFDFVGPSYLSCFSKFNPKTGRNGFIIGDIFLDGTISMKVANLFLNKCSILWRQKRIRPFIGFMIGNHFDSECFRELRKLGIITVTIENILGKEIALSLAQLITTLDNAAAAVVNNPENVFKILSSIAKIEGAAFNVRGAFFELMIGRLFSLSGYNIDIRKEIKDDSGNLAEIDIKAVNKKECVCVECKGMAPGNLVNVDIIEDWQDRVLPRINAWLKRQEALPPARFEFIVSSGYTPEALDLISKIERNSRKRPIKFCSENDVLKRLGEWKETSLIDIFREHFIK